MTSLVPTPEEPYLLRPYAAEDHEMLSTWWKGHGWPSVPAPLIPPFSFIAHDLAGVDQAFAAAYLDNGGTGVAMLTWITANPKNSPQQSLGALDTLIPFMRDHMRNKLDYPFILAPCRLPSLARLLQKHGFMPAGETYTEYIYGS